MFNNKSIMPILEVLSTRSTQATTSKLQEKPLLYKYTKENLCLAICAYGYIPIPSSSSTLEYYLIHQLFRLSTEFSDSPLANIRKCFEVLFVVFNLDGRVKLCEEATSSQPFSGDAAVLWVVKDRVEIVCSRFADDILSFCLVSRAE